MTSNTVSVLVVDDEPAIRRLLRTTLAVQPYRVLEAADGKAALESIRRGKPDVVILDLGLPDIDGLEIIRRVRVASRVPILVLSSRGDERGKVEALEAGADDYVTKPFGTDELM